MPPFTSELGCGDIAFRRYLPAVQELGDEVELVATCDIDRTLVDWTRGEYGAQQSFANANERLAQTGFHGVIVLTSMVPHGTAVHRCFGIRQARLCGGSDDDIFCVTASCVADLPGYHGEINDKGAM